MPLEDYFDFNTEPVEHIRLAHAETVVHPIAGLDEGSRLLRPDLLRGLRTFRHHDAPGIRRQPALSYIAAPAVALP